MDRIRSVRFRPYREGPTFALTLWDTDLASLFGKARLRYRLTMRGRGRGKVLFDGDDFWCSPLLDSDATVKAVMGFLTRRRGDNYTPAQLDYLNRHAEALACEVAARFGDE